MKKKSKYKLVRKVLIIAILQDCICSLYAFLFYLLFSHAEYLFPDANNFNNIMILCPNHHRIIHAYNPIFKLKNKEFLYPNGYKEGLLLNLHL